jgi:hypothetical protein
MFLWQCFQMNMDDNPHFFLVEDGRLCSKGQHCPGFSRVLYDALLRLGYEVDVPFYRCRLSMVDDLDICATPGFMAKPNAHSICNQELSLHTYRIENGYRITNVSIYNIFIV